MKTLVCCLLLFEAASIKILLRSGTVDLPQTYAAFLDELMRKNSRAVLISFGNPYAEATVPNIPTYVCAYENVKALQEVTAEALYRKTVISGRLPVTVSPTMKRGFGLSR